MMTCMPVPDHASVNEALERAGSGLDASECHGLICGVLSLDGQAPPERWMAEIARDLEPGDALASEMLRIVEELGEQTRRQFHDPDLVFQLLLPDEDEPLTGRVDAMKRWSLGYGFGLAIGGLKDPADLPDDSAEIVRDIAQFARTSIEDEESEENEVAYTELVEFLRIGVLLVHAESPESTPWTSVNPIPH